MVVQPLADDLTAELSVDKIMIGRPGGLSLSSTAGGQQEQLASSASALSFDTQLWGFDREANFSARQADLVRLAAMAPANKRKQARFNLARFYLAREMSSEAKAVLDVALAEKAAAEDVTGTVLRAVANVMLDRPDEALKELSNPRVGNQHDAPIWRAVAFAGQGKWPQAHAAFKNVDSAMAALPLELQRMALRRRAANGRRGARLSTAPTVSLNELETIGVPPEMEPSFAVLTGRLNEGLGHKEDALTNYRAAADFAGPARRRARAAARNRAAVSPTATCRARTRSMRSRCSPRSGAATRPRRKGSQLLAHLYTEDNRYRDAFHVMRAALVAHPNSDFTRKIQDEAAVTFETLFLGGKGDALPPVEALGLFYDFRELTPIGRRGDEMIRRLADRLVSVDLLDQAAELLQHQVDHRLQGAARAQVATRLAVIYLMNRKPDRALATLRTTRTADLSNDLRDQRLLLEARALSDIGRHDLALELIANISSREAIRLRSDILWAARRWRDAAEQIEVALWRPLARIRAAQRGRAVRYPARGDRLFARRRADRAGAVAREICGQDGGYAGPSRLRRGQRADRHRQRGIPGGRQEGRRRRYARWLPARHAHALSGRLGNVVGRRQPGGAADSAGETADAGGAGRNA